MKLNKSFGYILNLAARKLKKALDEGTKKHDLTNSQWVVLKLLSENDKLTQVEIAENIQSDKMTVGAVVEKLIDKKLVERRKSEIDKRAYEIKILESGRELANKITREAVGTNSKALKGFSDNEIKQFTTYLERVILNFKGED